MCGITGIHGERADDRHIGQAMVAALAPRGPDAEGIWHAPGVLLGHRRLAVLNPDGSAQPMCSADGTTTIVFNGEIYNFAELRQELLAAGVPCTVGGDTEVLLAAWMTWGRGCLERLRGMFAFAVWDAPRRVLTVVRDHLGIKPLYWFHAQGTFAFASEPKALHQHPACPREPDPAAIARYLECQYVPGTASIWRGIHRLAPGHLLEVAAGKAPVIHRWSHPDRGSRLELGVEEATERIHHLLRASVRSMLVADVPIGAFLSGGVDSSTLVALMAEAGPVESFTLDFGDEHAASEHREAAEVARILGTRHHPLRVSEREVLAMRDTFLSAFDEPFGDPAALPTMLLAQGTRRQVTVALSGEGADEVFGGYRAYLPRIDDPARHRRWGWTAPMLRCLPERMCASRRLRALTKGLARVWTTLPCVIAPEQQRGWFTPALSSHYQETVTDLAAAVYERTTELDHVGRVMAVDRSLWLPDDLLVKVDRATMAFGLEARVPYLDPDLLAFAARLPSGLQLDDGRTGKALLKRIACRYLPADLVHRRKKGFNMPLATWLRNELRPLMEDCLGPHGLAGRGILRTSRLERLRHDLLTGDGGAAHVTWPLITLELWFRRWQPDWRLSA
jgi:asparagine synthase (glutamine-hydrolysing)